MNAVRWCRTSSLLLGAALAAACSEGSGHHPSPVPACGSVTPAADACTGAPAMAAGQPFTVSGIATYDLVPAVYLPASGSGTLDFAHAVERPVREADVEIRQCGDVLARTATDAAGAFSATFTPGAAGQPYAVVLARTASPPVQVTDNVNCEALWAVAQPIASGAVAVHATHGWTGRAYGPARIAAPFAILDATYAASHALLDVRAVALGDAPLAIGWSPLNSPSSIGTSSYVPSEGRIYVLGAEGVDSDEFDRQVILHEWSHYLEASFSRSDSLGGTHYYAEGDVLDPTVAWSEGFATGFAGILAGERVFANTYWNAAGPTAWGFDLEPGPAADDPAPGPFSELSVARALWDLHDAVPPGDDEPWDATVIGLGPLFDTLAGPQRTTPAMTTLASFVAGLKAQPGVDPLAVDALLARYDVGPIADAFGAGDAAFSGADGVYAWVPPPSSTPSRVTAILDGGFRYNERPQNQYYVFTAAGTQASVTATSGYDVDLYAYASGTLLDYDSRPYTSSRDATVTFPTAPGTVYVVQLNGWGGLGPTGAPTGVVGRYTATVAFEAPAAAVAATASGLPGRAEDEAGAAREGTRGPARISARVAGRTARVSVGFRAEARDVRAEVFGAGGLSVTSPARPIEGASFARGDTASFDVAFAPGPGRSSIVVAVEGTFRGARRASVASFDVGAPTPEQLRAPGALVAGSDGALLHLVVPNAP